MKFIYKDRTPIIVSYSLCNIIGQVILGQKAGALAIFPFIVVRDNVILKNKEYIRHESIHLRQYIETLFVGVLIIGLLQYVYARYILKKSKIDSYYFMSHEQEAHQNDEDENYLKNRKPFSFYKYLLPKNKKIMKLVNGKRVIYG
jgi:hypothetical protein